MAKEYIRDFYGKAIGSIETTKDGDKIARDFYGKMLGTYKKKYNKTYDFYGRMLAIGDITNSLIWDTIKK